jgi:cob(I)alamin adenosyltransferase
MKNKIYTKTGDKGETSLIGGTRLPKYHLRIECYGTLDELNSFVGYLRDQLPDETYKSILLRIQDRLFTAESLLATDPQKPILRKLPQLAEGDISLLESEIDKMSEDLPELKSFILPGGHTSVSLCHICRTVCRRAESNVIRLSAEDEVDEIVIRYLNRLSDYFFALSRRTAFDHGIPDLAWSPEI